ncbi:hypothetical protein [Fictibacillus nanhaiensis]|uniref:hypothetical protein n=1 Tax=Fictibacillus nanhaiensis TaxID=742169 RepID=UPI003C277A12
MNTFPTRRTKHKRITRNKNKFWLITNLWMLYLIVISVLYLPNSSTYSKFNDTERIANTIATLEDFCSDKEYEKKNKKACMKKDDSGIGNGPNEGDDGEIGDPDNPGKGNDDKKDCLPDECVDDHPNNGNQSGNSKGDKSKSVSEEKKNETSKEKEEITEKTEPIEVPADSESAEPKGTEQKSPEKKEPTIKNNEESTTIEENQKTTTE